MTKILKSREEKFDDVNLLIAGECYDVFVHDMAFCRHGKCNENVVAYNLYYVDKTETYDGFFVLSFISSPAHDPERDNNVDTYLYSTSLSHVSFQHVPTYLAEIRLNYRTHRL